MAQISPIHKAVKFLLEGVSGAWGQISRQEAPSWQLNAGLQLKAVFCEQDFSWEFAQVTWAPRQAYSLLCDVK